MLSGSNCASMHCLLSTETSLHVVRESPDGGSEQLVCRNPILFEAARLNCFLAAIPNGAPNATYVAYSTDYCAQGTTIGFIPSGEFRFRYVRDGCLVKALARTGVIII